MVFAILNGSLSPITCNIVSRLDFECICHVILIRKGQPWPTSSASLYWQCTHGEILGLLHTSLISLPCAEFVTPPTVSCPSSEDNTAVIAGVVGGLVGLTVVVLFLVFILWYQFCRGSDYEEEDGKENAFDFIKKRTEAVNISTASPVDQDIEKSDFNIGSGAASRPSDETIL